MSCVHLVNPVVNQVATCFRCHAEFASCAWCKLVFYIFYLLPSLLPPLPLPFPPPSPLPFPLSPPSLYPPLPFLPLPLPFSLFPPPLYLYPLPTFSSYPPSTFLPSLPTSTSPPPLPSSCLLQELSLCQQVHQGADVYVLRYEPHLAQYPDFRFRGFVHKVCHCHMYNCSLNCFNLYSI